MGMILRELAEGLHQQYIVIFAQEIETACHV